MSESESSESSESYCAFCTAGYLAAHRHQLVIECAKCGEYACKYHGDMVPFANLAGDVYRVGMEWHCYECSGRKDGKHVK